MTRVLPLLSTSVAADLGFLALADIAVVAAALRNAEWRIIGGHMVQLLIHRYPTPNCQQRGTADADAGVGPQIAASAELHERLRQRDYRDECGNRYVRTHPDGTIAIDILVPDGADAGANIIAGARSIRPRAAIRAGGSCAVDQCERPADRRDGRRLRRAGTRCRSGSGAEDTRVGLPPRRQGPGRPREPLRDRRAAPGGAVAVAAGQGAGNRRATRHGTDTRRLGARHRQGSARAGHTPRAARPPRCLDPQARRAAAMSRHAGR